MRKCFGVSAVSLPLDNPPRLTETSTQCAAAPPPTVLPRGEARVRPASSPAAPSNAAGHERVPANPSRELRGTRAFPRWAELNAC